MPYSKTLADAGHPDAESWLAALLDHIDCGLLLVDNEARLLYANRSARQELANARVLKQQGHTLHTHRGADAQTLLKALDAARNGGQNLVTLGSGEQQLGVTAVPAATGTLLVLGQRAAALPGAVRDFARSIALTPAETRVLGLLCLGLRPVHIAQQAGVAISTVRTQIGNIRHKAGAANIRDLLRQVAELPPLVSTDKQDSANPQS